MNRLYTNQNTLISYLYNETDLFTTLEIEQDLRDSKSLRAEYKAMQQAKLALNTLKKQPKSRSISRILAYSRSNNLAALV